MGTRTGLLWTRSSSSRDRAGARGRGTGLLPVGDEGAALEQERATPKGIVVFSLRNNRVSQWLLMYSSQLCSLCSRYVESMF